MGQLHDQGNALATLEITMYPTWHKQTSFNSGWTETHYSDMHAESVRMRAPAAKHWRMHEVFIKSGFFLRITACVEVISRSPTWPSVQAGCPLWQLEIISFISHFALVTHIAAKDTDTHTHTTKAKTPGPNVAAHTCTCTNGLGQCPSTSPALQTKPTFYTTLALFIFQSEPDLHPSCPPSIPASIQTLRWGFTSRSCAQNVF